MPSDLYIIDPRADVAGMVALARDHSNDEGMLYFPHTKKQAVIPPMLEEVSARMTLIPFDTINSDIDDELFGYGQAIAMNASAGVPEASLRWSFYVLLQEHIVAELRRAEQLRYMLGAKRIDSVYWLSTSGGGSTTRDVFQALYPQMVGLGDYHYTRIGHAISRIANGQQYSLLDDAQIRRLDLLDRSRPTVCVSTNMEDNRYRETVLPLVSQLLRNRNVVLLPVRPAVEGQYRRELLEHGVRQRANLFFLDGSRLTDKVMFKIADVSPIIKKASPSTAFEALERIYGGVVRDIVATSSLSLLTQCRMSWEQSKVLAKYVDMGVVSPGRPLRSTLLVAALKERKKPSIELQSGTLSRNRRFIPPVADEVLAIDEVSRDTYAYLGRSKGVRVIGGIKIDNALAPFRGMSVETARETMGLPVDTSVWLLASQPVGVDKMKVIAEQTLDAVRSFDATLLIKMHPNENTVYEDVYQQLAEQRPGIKVIVDRTTSAPLAVCAADVVLTHFSTVGIEAHILGKLTIAVNPFKGELIFDLPKMGVAHLARSAEDIVKIVGDQPELARSETTALTDGRAMKRCLARIDKSLLAAGISVESPDHQDDSNQAEAEDLGGANDGSQREPSRYGLSSVARAGLNIFSKQRGGKRRMLDRSGAFAASGRQMPFAMANSLVSRLWRAMPARLRTPLMPVAEWVKRAIGSR